MIKLEEHVKMAYQIAGRFTPTVMVDKEDIKQVALIGLYKATQNYKEELGFNFSTYAYKVMRNEILKELKRFRSHNSLEEMELDIADTSPSPEEETLGSLEAIRGILTDREYKVVRLTAHGYNQKEISLKVGFSQSQVSRIFLKAKVKVREVIDNGSSANVR